MSCSERCKFKFAIDRLCPNQTQVVHGGLSKLSQKRNAVHREMYPTRLVMRWVGTGLWRKWD